MIKEQKKKSSIPIATEGVTVTNSFMGLKGVKMKKHSNEEMYIHKTCNDQVYQQFKLLEKLKIGVPIIGRTKDELVMKVVKPLHKLKKSELPKDIIDQLKKIKEILIKNEIAHCDIKISNIAIDDGKVVLLDADDSVKFGEMRKVCTK